MVKLSLYTLQPQSIEYIEQLNNCHLKGVTGYVR